MTTAKPQFPDQPEASDDLIAELARMMAQDAQGNSPAPAAAPVTTPAPTPQPQPSRTPPRIPGLENSAPASRPPLDFGRAPTATPVIMPEPLSNWQSFSPAKPAPAQPENRQEPVMRSPEPARQEPARQEPTPQAEPARQDVQARREPDFGAPSNAGHSVPPPRVEREAANPQRQSPERGEDFGFNFGLSQSNSPAPQQAGRREPEQDRNPDSRRQSPEEQASDDATYDTIADLIAAELDDEGDTFAPLDYDDEPLATEAGEENMVEPPREEPTSRPSAPQGNPMLRPVNFTPRETPQADRFSVSPVFGLGGRANPKPAGSLGSPVATNVQPQQAPPQHQQSPQPVAQQPIARQPVAPEPQPQPVAPPARQEPMMPRHQPIAPQMAAIAPHVSTDPIDEIESLIGDAVRVELETRPKNPFLSTPVVNSQHAPLAPQRTSIPLGNTEPHSMTSEDAILAAAAASGAQVDSWDVRHTAPEKNGRGKPADKREDKKEKARLAKEAKQVAAGARAMVPRRGGRRQFIGPAVAVTLLLVAGLGLYWVLGMGHTDGTAPVLTADTAAVKEIPPAAAPAANAPSGSVVFNEIDGNEGTNDNQEQIVSRDQTNGEEVARVIAPENTDDTGLANRKVRTVTVRPDGTIVNSGADALAGTEVLPVDRPNVPAIPGQPANASDLLAGVAPTAAAPALSGTPVDPNDPTAGTPVDLPPFTAPANTGPVTAAGAPVPMPRPTFRNNNASITPSQAPQPTSPVNALVADIEPAATAAPAVTANSQIVDLIGNLSNDSQPPPAVQQVAAVRPAPTPAAQPQAQAQTQPAAAPTSAAPAYVQLSSQRSEQDAMAALDTINRRFGSLFAGTLPEIKRADLGDRGIYYRVRLPSASLQAANETCANVKAGGGDCIITTK